MRTWYSSEMAYHPAWKEGIERGPLRVNFPNEAVDPVEAGQLLTPSLAESRPRHQARIEQVAAIEQQECEKQA